MLRTAFSLFLVFGTCAVSAQPSAPTALVTPASVVAAAPRTAADTVQAIHHLFKKHRRIGNALTFGAIAADMTLAGVSAAAEGSPKSSGGGYGWSMGSFNIGFGGFALIYGLVAAPVMGVGIQQLIAYGPKHEAKVLAQYSATGQLPIKFQRQLRKHLR